MLETILNAVQETFFDMAQNQISIFVVIVLGAIILALLIAIFSPHWKNVLVRMKFLERDESPRSLLFWVIGIIIAVKLFQAFLIQPFIVDGTSMLNTFHNNEFLLVDKLSYNLHEPTRGDVVIFKLYEGNGSTYAGRYLIKRVIGLPGERVVVRNGITTIYNDKNPNGFVVEEPYVTYKDTSHNVDVKLTENQFFVMGDNRLVSYDSRIWGPLDKNQLRGRALVRVFPFAVFSLYPGNYSYDK